MDAESREYEVVPGTQENDWSYGAAIPRRSTDQQPTPQLPPDRRELERQEWSEEWPPPTEPTYPAVNRHSVATFKLVASEPIETPNRFVQCSYCSFGIQLGLLKKE